MNYNDDPARPPSGTFQGHGAGEPWVIEGEQQLQGSFSGAAHVLGGATLTIAEHGQLYGPLTFFSGSIGYLVGEHLGPLHLEEGAHVEIEGLQNGPAEVDAGAVLKIAPLGRLAGTARVAGVIESRGVRAGNTVLAGGEVHDIDGGGIEPPMINRSVSPPEA
ncbi:hypothetical protein [Nesterenkonia halotolerans]|uniref:Polymer-forming cytoskeletal protein n=1 Tax=Nesterenkonia halotolerans TaxID=225325 RepID=A0ABR9J632_9MICC|nr:hypothetical protein [Nesterenkonia halotolerans]MBE1514434.1 hypothetical protein [Nesterenkonia halotolerans]